MLSKTFFEKTSFYFVILHSTKQNKNMETSLTNYPTNVTDDQWRSCKRYLKKPNQCKTNLREVLNAIFYVNKTGCQWRMLPKDFPNWNTVYGWFNKWTKKGILIKIHDKLAKMVREKLLKKEAEPTVVILDSQSTKNTLVANEKSKGFDGGKRVKGVKKHIAVDTNGLLMAVVITPANKSENFGSNKLIRIIKDKRKRVSKAYADQGYKKMAIAFAKECGIDLQIVKKNNPKVFEILEKRWIVERSFAWMDMSRRNSKFYERTYESCISMIQISFIRMMLNRLYII